MVPDPDHDPTFQTKSTKKNWQTLGVRNSLTGQLKDFLNILKIFLGNRCRYGMYLIKDELDYLEEKFAKMIQIYLSKRSDLDSNPDPVQIFRNRI